MSILVASDKFKGCLSSQQVNELVIKTLQPHFNNTKFDSVILADGGEGTAASIVTSMKGSWIEVQTQDAIARPISASYGLIFDNVILFKFEFNIARVNILLSLKCVQQLV
jgi:glycerate kinase